MGFSWNGWSMRQKHHNYKRSDSTWVQPCGKRLWCITPTRLKSGIFLRRNKSWHLNKSVKRVPCSVFGYQIRFQDKGLFDQFGPPKRLKFKEWDGEGSILPSTLDVLIPWAKESLPDWSEHWDRSWRENRCLGDFVYWTAEVLSSRWWTDRAGVLKWAVLAPSQVKTWGVTVNPTREVKGIWGKAFVDWDAERNIDSVAGKNKNSKWIDGTGVVFVSREECNGLSMTIKLMTEMRGVAKIPSLGALVAFVTRFWGKSLGDSLKSEIKKHAHLSERWAWEGHR